MGRVDGRNRHGVHAVSTSTAGAQITAEVDVETLHETNAKAGQTNGATYANVGYTVHERRTPEYRQTT